MLDIKLIREQTDWVIELLNRRGGDHSFEGPRGKRSFQTGKDPESEMLKAKTKPPGL